MRGWWTVVIGACVAACGRFGFDQVDGNGIDPTGDGGSIGDGVMGDGVMGDGAALACPVSAIACDGFESGGITMWTRIDQVGAGSSAQVQTATKRTGMYAFEANKPPSGNSGTAAVVMTRCMAVPSTTCWMVGLAMTR